MPNQSIYSLQEYFFNEDSCIKYLRDNGCFYESIPCPCCKRDMLPNIGRHKFRCPRGDCRREITIRTGTFFEGSQLPCSKILLMAYLWINRVPMTSIETLTGHSSKTVCAFLNHFRNLITGHLEESDTVIGGEGVVVEIDESKFGKRKHHRGHHVEGVWILGGVERTPERNLFLLPIETRDSTTLLNAIITHVRQGSVILTDMWKGYSQLTEAGFQHHCVNHSKHFTDPETGITTNTIEGTWNGVKLSIATRSRVRENMEERLHEFIWRRKNQENLWTSFLSAIRDIHYELVTQ